MIVQKVLRFLPMRFDPKIPSLEERADLATLSMDKLHGILTTYETRTEEDSPPRNEATFKASNKRKKNKQETKSKPNSYCSYNDDSNEDEEMVNFIRKLKKGTDKYKGKLPFKCFHCCKISHFANKCPHAKNKENDEEEVPKK
jgi:hypothetical protein